MTSNFLFVAALVGALFTCSVAHRYFQSRVKLGSPVLLAAAVAALAFLGIVSYGPAVLAAVWTVLKWLLPALLLLLLLAVSLCILVLCALADGHQRTQSNTRDQVCQPTALPQLPAPSPTLPPPRRRRSNPTSTVVQKPAGLRRSHRRATGIQGPL